MSFKATLIKGKTFNCGKYTFNASEPDRKSQIVEEEFALLLAKNEKFKIESIKESEIIKSEIKSEAIDTKEPNIFVLIDWIEEATGYGNIAKKLLNKYSGTIKYVQKGPEFKDNLDLKDVPHESYVIQLTTPNCFRDLSNVKKRIGFTMFETTKIPPDWPKICNKTCDLLIVPSEENKKVFKNCGVKVPIEVIPLWVDNTYKYYDRPKRKTFTFLFVGGVDDHNRKGWYELQKAFKQEFKNEKDVRLIFKCLFINIHNEMALQIMEDDRIKFVKGKLKNKELYKLYKKADCFVFASHGEGFGLPPLEAMACFPSETKINFKDNIEEVHKRKYEGNLITIKTKNNIVSCTPNHLFLTINGWTKAKDLSIMDSVYIYEDTNNGEKRKETNSFEMESRRIGDFVGEIQAAKKRASTSFTKKDNKRNTKQNKRIQSSPNEIFGYSSALKDNFFKRRINLFSWLHRWRRNTNIQTGQSERENSSLTADSKYRYKNNKLDKRTIGLQKSIYSSKGSTREPEYFLSNWDKRITDNQFVGKVRTLFNFEEKTLWNFDLFHQIKINKNNQSTLFKERKKLLEKDKTIKCERITSVNHQKFNGYVYNLTTSSGIYFANNFLVHNCGLPTIVTDWMGCKEFVDNKICYPLKVDKLEEALYPDTYGDVGDWAYISVKGLRKQMRYVYENREEAKQKGKLAAKVVNEKFRFKHFNYKLEDIVSNMEDGNHIVSQRFLKNVKKTDRQISIIIPSFGREDLTKLCIKAIQKDDYFEKEIIVIDDGYGIDFKDNSVRCIKHETNKGFSTSVNTGIKASKFEYIFIINNDVFVYKDCFKEMFFALKNHADIVGAKLFYPDGTIQHAGVRYLGNYLFYHNFWYKTKGGDDPLYCPVTGALMGIKKKVFNKMGYFDEKFFISCEDMDFCFRAMRAGLKVLYWPKAKAIHLEGATRGNGHESKTLGNPIAYKKEVETMEYFKTLYTETEVVELCKPYQF